MQFFHLTFCSSNLNTNKMTVELNKSFSPRTMEPEGSLWVSQLIWTNPTFWQWMDSAV